MNAKPIILHLTQGEKILAISLGPDNRPGAAEHAAQYFTGADDVERGLSILDFKFDGGYGGERGYAVHVWTKSWLIVKTEYDGAENYIRLPRNPDEGRMTPWGL